VEGVIIAAAPETKLVDLVTALQKVPVVAIENFFSSQIDSILLQNRQSARQATEHLIWHGYRSVSCIGARPNVFSYQERLLGYSDATCAHGLKEQIVMALNFDDLARTLDEEFRKSRPEAVLALSDVAAGHVLTTCQKLNITLESRPKIISYDDFDFAPLLQVPLTVVRQPVGDMVAAVVLSLFGQIEGRGAGGTQTISMPGELVIRRSCGCA
jgi:LacI family transcriptional regulator